MKISVGTSGWYYEWNLDKNFEDTVQGHLEF
jgi:hypothetical protein